MIETPMLIPVDEVGGESRLFMDYVSGAEAPIRDVLGGFRRGEDRWGQPPPPREQSDSWVTLVDRLVTRNRSLGVSKDVVDKLAALGGGEAVGLVVTGQQPGVLGGPLLSLHKLATAVELAGYLEQTGGVPHVPLYWVGADDTDFNEIRELFLVDGDLTPLSTSIDQSAYTAATPVGDIAAAAVARVWEAVQPLVSGCPGGPFLDEVVGQALGSAADNADATARILCALSGGRVAFVDGREPVVRVHAKDLFLRFFDGEREVREAVEASGRSLEAAGYHSQLSLGPDSGVFKVVDGRRMKITDAQRTAERDQLIRDASRFSPGVVLRNLIQDSVFQPTAAVLGPAEIAYRAQLDGVYRLMGIAQPIAFPRMQATYLPAEVLALPGMTGADGAAGLLADPAAFVKALYASRRPDEIESSAGRFKSAFEEGKASFLETASRSLDERLLEKTRKKLADLSRRLDQALDVRDSAGKSAALAQWPFLPGLAQLVRRDGRPQDRYASSLTPFVFAGGGALRCVAGAAEGFVQAALDGTPPHVVYSTRT